MDREVIEHRNIAVHSYEKMDWAIVHAIASAHLGSYEDFARAVIAAIAEQNNHD